MNPRSTEDELSRHVDRIQALEVRVTVLEGEAKLLKFFAATLTVSTIGLIIGELGRIIF